MLDINTDDTHERCDTSTDESTSSRADIPSTIEPLGVEILTSRRVMICFKHRMRRLAKPAFVSTDASWRDGVASLAFALIQCQ